MTKEKKTRKKTALKRLTITLCVVVMLFALAVPCFAWTRLPSDASNNEYCFAFKTPTENLNFCIYAYSHNGNTWYVSIDGTSFNYYDSTILDTLVYVPIKATSPSEDTARAIIYDKMASYYNSAQGQLYTDSINDSYDSGYYWGYQDGEDANEVGKNMILTIFSVPSYVLSNVFNFEVFGINLYALITFLLTISIVAVVLRKIL